MKIEDMTLNGSSIRNIGRVLENSNGGIKNAESQSLLLTLSIANECQTLDIDIKFSSETGEFWNFVRYKGNIVLALYAIERRRRVCEVYFGSKLTAGKVNTGN